MRSLHCPSCGAATDPHATRCAYCSVVLAVESCPSCFGMLFVGSRHCVHCGGKVGAPDRRGPGDEPARCPRCRDRPELLPTRVGPMDVDQCPTCTGVFVPTSVIEDLMVQKDQAAVISRDALAAASTQAPHVDTVTYLPCARCEKRMLRSNFGRRSGVIVDVCKAHGTWFDVDELRRASAFVAAGGLDATRRRELEELDRKISEKRAQAVAKPTPGGFNQELPVGSSGLSWLIDLLRLLD